MNRHPWRSRVWLAGLFDVVAGGLVGVALYLGFTDGPEVAESLAAGFTSLLALAVNLGVIQDGETKTTPVGDELGPDGLPLVGFRKIEDLTEAAAGGDLIEVRRLLGVGSEH